MILPPPFLTGRRPKDLTRHSFKEAGARLLKDYEAEGNPLVAELLSTADIKQVTQKLTRVVTDLDTLLADDRLLERLDPKDREHIRKSLLKVAQRLEFLRMRRSSAEKQADLLKKLKTLVAFPGVKFKGEKKGQESKKKPEATKVDYKKGKAGSS